MAAAPRTEEQPRVGASAPERPPGVGMVGRARAAAPAWSGEAAWAAAAAAIASLVAFWVLRLWDGWTPSQPLDYGTDSLYYLGVVQSTLEHGWYLHNPDLGVPFGLDSHDFPVVSNDALQLVLIKALGVVLGSAYTVTNAFYLLTYPFAAAIAFWTLRRLSVTRMPALVASVLFATTPYHFLRGETHLFFASYYLVPLSCLLAMRVLGDEPLLGRRAGATGLRAWATWRTAAVLGLSALIAGAGIYYAVFTTLLVGAAAVLRMLGTGRTRASAGGAVVVVAIGVAVLLLQAPTVLYRLEHGANPVVAERTGADTEFFALKLDQLVFPVVGHRIEPLARFTDDYLGDTRMRGEPHAFLGALGTLGLAWLLVVCVATVAGGGRRRIGALRERQAAAMTLVAFLLATAGGVSAVIGYALTAQIRAWSRMSIFIAFFALLALALLLDRLVARAGTPARRRGVAIGLGVLLIAGVVEQTSPRFAPDHEAISARLSSDAGYVHRVQDRLGEGSVLQLPYAPYPEDPAHPPIGDYRHIMGYLNSSRLQWSYGAMKGRPEDWQASLQNIPLRALLDGAAAARFDGVHVDRRFFTDNGAALEAELTRELGPPAVVSRDGTLLFYDLRSRAAELPPSRRAAMEAATVTPVRVAFGDGIYYSEGVGEDRWRWAADRAEIRLTNPVRGPRRFVLDLMLRTDADKAGRTTVTFPDGDRETVDIDQWGSRLTRAFAVPPGESRLRFDTVGPQIRASGDERRLFVQLRGLTLAPEELCATPATALPRARACARGPRPQLR